MNEWIYQWKKPYNKQTLAEDTKHKAGLKFFKNLQWGTHLKLSGKEY